MELWIARDKSGSLYLYEDKPLKKSDEFICKSWAWIFPSLFPEVTFENSPQKVELGLMEEIVGVKESPTKTFPRVNEFETGVSYRR